MSANRHGIKDFVRGRPLVEQLKADKLNAILKELESLRITKVVNGSFKKLPGGTEIVVQQRAAVTATAQQPWDLTFSKTTKDEKQYLVSVNPGTLNGFLPSNWNSNEAQDVLCISNQLYYAKAVVSTDGQAMTSVNVQITTSPPIAQQPALFGIASNIEIVFGLFLNGKTYRTIGNGNIKASPKLWLTTERQTPPQAGELPFIQYFLFA